MSSTAISPVEKVATKSNGVVSQGECGAERECEDIGTVTRSQMGPERGHWDQRIVT